MIDHCLLNEYFEDLIELKKNVFYFEKKNYVIQKYLKLLILN